MTMHQFVNLIVRTLGCAVLLSMLVGAAAPVAAPAIRPFVIRAPNGAPAFGINSHLATRYPDPSSMATPAALLRELGVSWVREDFHWHRVQPRPDQWDWTFTDAAMRALLSQEVQVLGVLGPSVGWATSYSGDTSNDVSYYAPDPDAFAEYVRGVVSRYRRYVHHWEIWNEPDHAVFWRPAPDPAAYTRLLIRAAAVIREVDPDATILIGGTNPFDTTFLRSVAENGGWGSFDVIALHPYIDPYSPEEGNLVASADGVRALGEQVGRRPIWVTELGWASGPGDRDRIGQTDEQFQASYLVRSMLTLWQAGIDHIFWYSFKDDPGNPYGLVRAGSGRTDYSVRKPAFEALRTLNQQLKGARFVETRDLFTRDVRDSFTQVDTWRRASQPNGTLRLSTERAHTGATSAQLSYNFTTRDNDYVAFERSTPLTLSSDTYAVGLWVYGDASNNSVKIWLRDAEGEVLQFALGSVGPAGWHLLSAPIVGPVEAGNRISGNGNSRVDFPATLQGVVLDDTVDRATGSGTIYLDDLSIISGYPIYDLRLQRGAESLDILWSPPGARVRLNSSAAAGRLLSRDGAESLVSAEGGQLRVNLGPAPVYLWHRR